MIFQTLHISQDAKLGFIEISCPGSVVMSGGSILNQSCECDNAPHSLTIYIPPALHNIYFTRLWHDIAYFC